jgi:colanic acid/amylovoran biosynthesis glycosyltransferase
VKDVAYIFNRYPVLSQQFMQREIAGLEAAGLRVQIFSLLRADGDADYFRAWELLKLPVALPRELRRDPRLLRDGWNVLRRHRPNNFENFFATVWATLFAVVRAKQFRRAKPKIIHGAWATGPATAAAILSRVTGVPFSFGAHAYDIYRNGGDAFLRPKMRAAKFVHTTTAANVEHLRALVPDHPGNKIILVRRGLPKLPPLLQRVRETQPIRLLSVARLVEKKGHRHQIAACAALRAQGVPFELQIIGDGPLRRDLQREIRSAKLQDAITLRGALAPSEIENAYRWSDIFLHIGIIDAQGDRDGLPNVIPEAFAFGLPVISSRTSGATEAVLDEETGLLVDVANPQNLAGAIKRLAADPELRDQLGRNGRIWVEENFLLSRNAELLAAAFREAAAII